MTTPAVAPPVRRPRATLAEGMNLPAGFRGPLAPLDVLTGDNRLVATPDGGVRTRQAPLPLLWQPALSDGHDGGMVAGRIDRVWVEGGLLMGEGPFDLESEAGEEAARLVNEKLSNGVSVDLDDMVVEFQLYTRDGEPFDGDPEDPDVMARLESGELREVMVAVDWRLMGATLVSHPAFDEARLEAVADYTGPSGGDNLVPEAVVAAAAYDDLPVFAVTGSTDLPVGDRERAWDGGAAAGRVFDMCTDGDTLDVECASRAFLLRRDDVDPQNRGAYALGFADVIDGRLTIVPRGVAALAGGRGVGRVQGVSAEERSRLESRVCTLYERVRTVHDDWPDCPFDAVTAAALDAVNADDEPQTQGMIALRPQNPAALVMDGGDPADELHVTLAFLGEVAALEEEAVEAARLGVAEVAKWVSPFDATVAGVGVLGGEDPPATVLFLNGQGLDSARGIAMNELYDYGIESFPEQHAPYLAHLTLGYGVDVEAARKLHGTVFRIGAVTLDLAGDQERLPLGEEEEAITAAAGHVFPAWMFANPDLAGPTPITVTESGRVFGHLATWGTCHIGFPGQCVTPPQGSDYSYFQVGEVDTTTGPIPVGKITLGAGHADRRAGIRAALDHYDNSAAAVAVVRAGDDTHGVWVAGAILPGVEQGRVDELRRSPLSGDWRRIGGQLELVAAHAVNVPGFPVPRMVAASAGERQMSLVASGPRPPLASFGARVSRRVRAAAAARRIGRDPQSRAQVIAARMGRW